MMAIAASARRKNPRTSQEREVLHPASKVFVVLKNFFIAGLTFLIICVPFFFLLVAGANPEAPKLENRLQKELTNIKQPAKAERLGEVRRSYDYKNAGVRVEAHYQSEFSSNDIKKFFDASLLKNGWHACKEDELFENSRKQHMLLFCKDDLMAAIEIEGDQRYYIQIKGVYNVLFIPDRSWWEKLNWQMLTGERN